MKPERPGAKVTTRWLWLEVGLAGLSAGLFILTIFSRDWIEAVAPVDPDQHSGALEWAIAAALLLVAIAFAARARIRWTAARKLDHVQRQEA
ncbi:MAG TPA: hypothetical protein VMS11_03435 [Solirubrobacterales bacterium]|nr:hypothetical protein [Solirubrobacterales bacterium]